MKNTHLKPHVSHVACRAQAALWRRPCYLGQGPAAPALGLHRRPSTQSFPAASPIETSRLLCWTSLFHLVVPGDRVLQAPAGVSSPPLAGRKTGI